MHEIKKLLYIDNDCIILNMMTTYFEDQGFSVFTALDGEEGLLAYQNKNPDVVLIDITIPKINGFTVLETIKNNTPNTPIIVVSSADNTSDVVQALRLGAWNYHLKPIEKYAIIRHSVEQALEKSRLIKENIAYQGLLEKFKQVRLPGVK